MTATHPQIKPFEPDAGLFRGRTGGLIMSTAILFTILVCASDTFFSAYTMSVLARNVAIYVLIALSQALCLVVGGMNLSVGAIGGFCTVMLGVCMEKMGLSGWVAIPLTLIIGAIAGLINGGLITRLKIDSFIVTLSMMFVFMGLASGISGGFPYKLPESFTFAGQGNWLGVPVMFVLIIVVLIAAAYLFSQTVTGRYLLATGGNLEAARLSGINTSGMIVAANTLSGLVAALVAILWASKNGSASPKTGDDWLIISFAVAIIGGTGLSGGVISATCLFMGAIIFALIKHALVELQVNDNYANAFLGALILLSIVIDRVRETQNSRRTS